MKLELTEEEARLAAKGLVTAVKVWERHSESRGITPETAVLREVVRKLVDRSGN